MGGVEDEEPASKRMKLSFKGLLGLSNGSASLEPVGGSSGDLMARPLPSEGDEEVVGSRGIIKREEFLRIITNALYSLGYKKSGAFLEQESGIPLHSAVVNLFMQQILDGNWDESVVALHKMGLADEKIIKSASFLILEQKFFELLDEDRWREALKTLRSEVTPLCNDTSRIRELSTCIVSPSLCSTICSPKGVISKVKSRPQLLEELQKLLPPTIVIPERRLEHLIEQALILQRKGCTFHNSLDKDMSLYLDHQCGRDHIPSRTLQVLEAHDDEVWFVRFSNSGKYLASSSNDRSTIIWEVARNGKFSLRHKLLGHQKPVCSVSWSPNDQELLTCGVEETVRRWDVFSGKCLQVYEKVGVGLVSCGWFPSGKYVFTGINDKSISMWELEGKELECWRGSRTLKISDLEISSDGKQILSICKENAVLMLNRETKVERLIEEDQIVTSFSLSKDNKFLLVNLQNQEIHLWSIEGDSKLVGMYRGHKRSRFIIRSCFGGFKQAFIASGSEDSLVYLWHKGSGDLIQALAGHSGSVNCVSWNPVNPHMLASASDDRTIRIWGLNDLDNVEYNKPQSNGNGNDNDNGNGNGNDNGNGNGNGNDIHYCNGGT